MSRFVRRSRLACYLGAATLLTATALVAQTDAQAAETLRIGGTGSALGGMQRLADAFMADNPDVRVVVLPSLGSGGGIKALIAGEIGLSVSARPLKPEEAAQGLIERQYATSPLVFATHPDTAADDVTLSQLVSVYRGDTTTWPDGTRLRLVMRPAAETDTAFLRTLSPEMDEAVTAALERADLFVAINDQDNATALEQIRGSLGLIALSQLKSENRDLKPLTLDGIAGTPETLVNGTYLYAKSFYIIDRPQPTVAGTAFVEFLASAKGEQLLNDVGYLPTVAADRSQM
jgi:phosphate transport system substrate-binding protein